jgi:nitrogen fixation/metabolism regulation signal transduction histidine kinase
MVSELEHSRVKLQQTEKVTAWQEIAQRMAHEIKNPLTPIKLSAQRILSRHRKNAGDLDRILEPAIHTIIREVDSLDELLREFRDFARMPAPVVTIVAVREIICEVLATYAATYAGVAVDTEDVDPNIRIAADRGQIVRVLSNLLKNAFEAIAEAGTIQIRTDLVTKGRTQYCRIQIRDTGSGIDPEFHNQVFNPYFTTKGQGTGLGLPIVERIIFDHNGQIWFETEQGVGTTFFVDLPAAGGVRQGS